MYNLCDDVMYYIEMFLLSLVATYWITCMYAMIFVLLENEITTTTITTVILQCGIYLFQ